MEIMNNLKMKMIKLKYFLKPFSWNGKAMTSQRVWERLLL
jgi:hypothetical protein